MRLIRWFAVGFTVAFFLLFSGFPETPADSHSGKERHSALVYPGPDGRLVYVPNEKGNTIPDFSHAGYCGGGVTLPKAPVRAKVSPDGDNDAGRIQAAIDRVSALPPDRNGIRGAVILKKGKYDLEKPLMISAGGVVLRGEGQDADGTVLVGHGVIKDMPIMDRHYNSNLIIIRGPKAIEPDSTTSVPVTDDYVPVGTRSFKVVSTVVFRPGDTVIVRRHGNSAWIHEIGMDTWEQFSIDFDRIITKIAGDTITVDAPLTCAIESRWGGGEVMKYSAGGRISQVGVENIRGMSSFDTAVRTTKYSNMDRENYIGGEYYSDEDHYWNFIFIDNAENVWVRNITALHFANSAVLVAKGGKRVTVQDCVSLEPVSLAGGGRRFTFQVRGQLCLVQRCFSDTGRHSFVVGDPTACGPNVFLDCTATRPLSSSEPHNHYAVGCLYDNVTAPLTARFWKGISIGWAGANCVFWNCEGMFLVQKPPTAQNYAIGHIGIHAMVFNLKYIDYSKENGFIESLDEHVQPKSLYLKQLGERMGIGAVGSIRH